MDLAKQLSSELLSLKSKGLYRSLKRLQSATGPRAVIDGRKVILLCSNDYLGLATHPELKKASSEAVEKYGTSSAASRLISGNMELHLNLEEELASFKGAEAALLFNSGYVANIGAITSLVGKGDLVFSDELCHASIVDGCRLSRATIYVYPHCDVSALESMLKRAVPSSKKLIITESLFSMDGDFAPLREVAELARKFEAWLMVDEAHAFGVFGPGGRGLVNQYGLAEAVDIQMATLGKAFGSFGAFVACAKATRDYLINKSRPFIYSTSLPPAAIAASEAAIGLVERSDDLRQRLLLNSDFFRRRLSELGIDTLKSSSQVVPLLAGDAARAMEVSSAMLERGVYAQGIRPPTVPQGKSRIRCSITAAHTAEDLEYSIEAIKSAFTLSGLI